ncbi:hypothetical protein Tco_0677921 [Tanacetum coccineum]|uniref:MAK10-like protein n=1 Tax=Tanacetum coccineum TaxID=301880 RepID=A0ABQ4XEV8_9ASTR
MGDANPIRTLGDYSKPSHDGYRNTIELPVRSNVVHLRSETIWLVQDGCSFHRLRSEDPNQHLEDFLKLVDSLNFDGENKEKTRLRKNHITPKCYHDVLTTSRRISLRSMDSRTIDQLAGGKLRDRNAKESWALLEDLALYDNESWNGPRDFAKPVKEISLAQDVPSVSDCRLIELENQVQRFMEAYLAPTNPSSPKCVHFVNSIGILNKEDETKEEGNVKTSTTEYEDHEMTMESEEEFGEETEDLIKEEEEDSLKHFDTLPTMKEFRLHYNWIMSKRLGPKRKPSNPGKICNFVGRVKGLKVFVGNFIYECVFIVLEDTTSVIDHDLGLYLRRRSLEVLRKFHWMILGGQFNQFLALGWLLEEIHVTWAHLEKKRTRLQTYTKSLEDLCK